MYDAHNESVYTFKWSTSDTRIHNIIQTANKSFQEENGLVYNNNMHNDDDYPAFKAAIANNGTLVPPGCSAWFLPSAYQWKQMIYGAGGASYLYSMAGLQLGSYWLSSEHDNSEAWSHSYWYTDPDSEENTLGNIEGYWGNDLKSIGGRVRACLAF